MQNIAITTFNMRCIKCSSQLNSMKIIVILFYFIAICIVLSLFSRHLFDELLALSIFFFRKIFHSYSKSWFFYLKYHYNENLTLVITLEHILHICQIMFKNSNIFTEKKFLSTHEIIKFFSFLFIFQNVFYFVFFVFAYKHYFCKRNNICICVIWF